MDTNQVKPEEVRAILDQKHKGKTEDKNTETIDGDIIDSENPTNDDVQNQEGKILETAFKELEVEDAIEKAKELRKLNTPVNNNTIHSNTTTTVHKAASSLWDVLVNKCHA